MTWNTTYRLNVDYFKSNLSNIPLLPNETQATVNDCAVCEKRLTPLITVSNNQGTPVLEKGICTTCGFVGFTRMPSQEWFTNFYKEQWDVAGRASTIRSRPAGAYAQNLQKVSSVAPSRDAHILDVGAGFGNFLSCLKRIGFSNLWGIEASAHRSEYCARTLQLSVVNVPVEMLADQFSLVKEQGGFDVIHSHHVLEHIYDLDYAITAFFRLLKPGGHVVFFVPNWDKIEPLTFIGHFLGHIRHFTPHFFSGLLKKHGFQIVEVDDQVSIVARKPESVHSAVNSHPPNIKKSERLVVQKTEEKVLRELFLESRPDSSNSRRFYFSGPNHSEHFSGTQTTWLGTPARLLIKRVLFGVLGNDQAIRGPDGNVLRLLRPATLLRYLARRVISFDKYEIGGTLQTLGPKGQKQPEAPLLEFKYGKHFGVSCIK